MSLVAAETSVGALMEVGDRFVVDCLFLELRRREPARVSAASSCFVFFLLWVGFYSVTALRENDQERFTMYPRHRLKLQAQTTKP